VRRHWLGFATSLAFAATANAQVPQGAIEATTATGEKVFLLPGGRWQYADPAKAEPQKQERAAEEQRERSAQGLFGGRRIYEGDRDYNRGSLNPNRR
jgi:hypothetical protein